MHTFFLKSCLTNGSSCDSNYFMKNFHFDAICNITQEPQELQRFNCACGFISKSTVIRYHQLLSTVISSNGKSHVDQLSTASSYNTPPYIKQIYLFPLNVYLPTIYSVAKGRNI